MSALRRPTTKIPHFSHQSSSTTIISICTFTIFKNQIVVNISLIKKLNLLCYKKSCDSHHLSPRSWVYFENSLYLEPTQQDYKHLHCNFQSQLYPLIWHRNSEHCRIGFLFSPHHHKSYYKLTRKPMLKISENLINFILRGDFVIQPNPG